MKLRPWEVQLHWCMHSMNCGCLSVSSHLLCFFLFSIFVHTWKPVYIAAEINNKQNVIRLRLCRGSIIYINHIYCYDKLAAVFSYRTKYPAGHPPPLFELNIFPNECFFLKEPGAGSGVRTLPLLSKDPTLEQKLEYKLTYIIIIHWFKIEGSNIVHGTTWGLHVLLLYHRLSLYYLQPWMYL